MTRTHIQFAGLISLSLVALGLLALIGYIFVSAIAKMADDGTVPLADAGLFTALLLSLQQTVSAMRSIWESQERQGLAEGLSNSIPTGAPNPPSPEGPTI
jgi:hypothetical protein